MTGSIADTKIDFAVNGLPDSGVAAYVTRPIDSDALYGVINKILYADTNVAQQPVNTNNLDKDMGPELIKLTQIDKTRAIAKLHGKAHLYEGLVQDFIAMQDHIQQLEMALEKGDIKNVKLIVHTYKSGLAYVGAFALATLGKQLDATISADETELHPDLIARIRLYINAITHITESFKSAV